MPAGPLILVADDDEEWRGLLSIALQAAGYSVALAPDGRSVLPLAGKSRPAVIVLDHDLGDTTGAKLCAELKSLPEYRGVPIVMLTAHPGVLADLIAGAAPDHFVAKAGGADELLLVLSSLVPASGQV